MALTTTAMTGPLLRWIYPRHMVERDLAELDAGQPAPATVPSGPTVSTSTN
jgi:hypothetical protein